VREVIDGLIVTLMVVHTLIALAMGWIGLTHHRASSGIVITWFGISLLTVVALGQALR
jgi:DNA-binding transcriptional regulator of glucitol operon